MSCNSRIWSPKTAEVIPVQLQTSSATKSPQTSVSQWRVWLKEGPEIVSNFAASQWKQRFRSETGWGVVLVHELQFLSFVSVRCETREEIYSFRWLSCCPSSFCWCFWSEMQLLGVSRDFVSSFIFDLSYPLSCPEDHAFRISNSSKKRRQDQRLVHRIRWSTCYNQMVEEWQPTFRSWYKIDIRRGGFISRHP